MRGYLVLVAVDDRSDGGDPHRYAEAHAAFHARVASRGRMLGSAALAGPDTATTLRHDGTRWLVSDGPYAGSAEQVAGYYEVELPDLDTALSAVRLLPASSTIEIRPTIRP